MHWTSLLTRRNFPPHARIIGDLDCIGCGYNLYSQRAGGNCPECGLAVHASMFTLARPDAVASSYRTIARSYLAMYLLVLPPVLPRFVGMDMSLLVGFVLLVAACFRGWSSMTLRYRAKLAQIPVLGPRLTAMFAMHAVETILLAGTVVLWYVALRNPAGILAPVTNWKLIVGGAWLAAWVLGLLITDWATLAVANMLEYETTRRELIIQLVLLVTSPLSAMVISGLALGVAVSTGAQIGALAMQVAGAGSFILVWSIALGYGIIAMLRLAGAAEHERDELDEDLLDTGRETLPHRTHEHEEPPEIKLE